MLQWSEPEMYFYSLYVQNGESSIEKENTLSNISQMAERGWWMEAMTVWPRPARLLMCSITFSAAKLSSPVQTCPSSQQDHKELSDYSLSADMHKAFSHPGRVTSTRPTCTPGQQEH